MIFRLNNLQKRFPLTLTLGVLLVFFIGISNIQAPNPPGGVESSDQMLIDEINECTTGLASGLATPDGRPLLWKNRDVNRIGQEYHYVDDGRIPFIGLTYENDVSGQYYAGINAAGFALENSNSYNLTAGPNNNGWTGDDDGEIHMLALATCRTVDDFQELMDSTNVHGRTLNSNYGAFDAFGGAAMFETGGYIYARVDAAETEEGFIIRANYSYSGHGLNNRPSHWGPNRHDRAYSLWKQAVDDNNLTAKFVFQQVIRNLCAEGMTDYAMPYEGYYQNYPYGQIPNGEVVCRATTASIFIGQGVLEGERPDNCIIWAMPGTQLGSIATPLFVRAGSVPVEYDSPGGSRLCNLARGVSDWVYDDGPAGSAVNTFKLINAEGNGYWDWSFPIEDRVFERTYRFLDSPNFSYDRLEAFQNTMAREVADAIDDWVPPFTYTELAEPIFIENNLILSWEPNAEQLLANGNEPRGFNVYRCTIPFREGERGESLGFVEGNSYTDRNPLPNGGYYRVEAVF